MNCTIHSQGQYQEVNWPQPVFEHLTLANGLHENSVLCILQDHLGYMWFGPQGDLVRYDGYNMKVYKFDPYDSLSINIGQMRTIYEDKSGNLWIGTNNGLNRFNRAKETFTRYNHNPDDPASINSNFIYFIFEDSGGNILVGTDKGLNLFNRQDESFENIFYKNSIYSDTVSAIIEDRITGNIYIGSKNRILIFDKDKKVLADDSRINELAQSIGSINSFLQTKDGSIWIAHTMGLSKLDLQINTINLYQLIPSSAYNIRNYFNQLTEDNDGSIWLISGFGEDGGLLNFDPQNKKFKHFKHDPADPHSISSSNTVWSVYIDRSGILWVGTMYTGLNKWDRNKSKFKRFIYDADKSTGDFYNAIFSIIEDSKGVIWFGTKNGLNSFHRNTGEFRNYKYDSRGINNTVMVIYKDESDIFWLGTETRGLVRFDAVRNKYFFYSNDPNNPESISHNTIRSILPDGNDILWIGTRGGGMNKFDKKTGKFLRYIPDPDNPQSLSYERVECIVRDRKGIMWVGTQGETGLHRFDQTSNSFKAFGLFGGGPGVPIIHEDQQGNFWVGTINQGLHLFDRENETFVYKHEFQNNLIRSILEDGSGNLWLGTDYALSKFDPKTHRVKIYTTSFNFEGNRFSTKCAFKTSTGEMLFGTYDGFILFHPDSIEDDPIPPQIVISNVSLFNRPGEELEYDGLTSEIKELNLSHSENDLRFHYVGFHYADPSKNTYKYMLEGYDKDWIDAGTQRNATYTNLEPGDYKFKVKAANSDGVWSQNEAAVILEIRDPWWETGWAYAFYIILFAAVIIALRRFELNRSRLKNLIRMQEFEAKKQHEVDEMKTRFIANLSHEFRTPLLLIRGPLEQMMHDDLGSKNLERCITVFRNTENLQTLINQLLELSQLESSSIPVKAQRINLITIFRGLTFAFESLAKEKNIELFVKNSEETIFAWIDKEKFEKIINNLLSNAFKFTPEGGSITVSINSPNPKSPPEEGTFNRVLSPPLEGRGVGQIKTDDFVSISVRDTGIGIPQAKLEKIFDRFFQVDDSIQRTYGGSGIGLALVKELVDLHRWNISVTSETQKGTEFRLKIPLADDYLDENQKAAQSQSEYSIVENGINAPTVSIRKKVFEYPMVSEIAEETNQDNKPCLLIVEDSKDVQVYLDDILNSGYSVSTAMNGVEGLKVAQEKIPDLIISDVMMPEMDGFEFCKRLKTDERTSHIPVILLTAKAASHDKIEGLETGADDYIMKPFEATELKVRIRNLIEQRKNLREYFKKQAAFDLTEAKVTSVDKKYLEKTISIINSHVSDTGFSVDAFADEIGMSRSQLHRKLVSLIGQSPGDLIRRIRLNKAAKLIEQNFGNISEIALEVGFNNPANFAQSFRKQFGVSPTEYKK